VARRICSWRSTGCRGQPKSNGVRLRMSLLPSTNRNATRPRTARIPRSLRLRDCRSLRGRFTFSQNAARKGIFLGKRGMPGFCTKNQVDPGAISKPFRTPQVQQHDAPLNLRSHAPFFVQLKLLAQAETKRESAGNRIIYFMSFSP